MVVLLRYLKRVAAFLQLDYPVLVGIAMVHGDILRIVYVHDIVELAVFVGVDGKVSRTCNLACVCPVERLLDIVHTERIDFKVAYVACHDECRACGDINRRVGESCLLLSVDGDACDTLFSVVFQREIHGVSHSGRVVCGDVDGVLSVVKQCHIICAGRMLHVIAIMLDVVECLAVCGVLYLYDVLSARDIFHGLRAVFE